MQLEISSEERELLIRLVERALAAWPGRAGLAITAASWAGLVRLFAGARRAEAVVEDALTDALGTAYRAAIPRAVAEKFAPAMDWRQLLLPFPVRHPEVERVR